MSGTDEWLGAAAHPAGRAALIVVFFASTNIPWTLDDYDQAKQAYTSFEMVRQGHWLYQHTPNESVATEPPLVGWVSATVFEATRWWEGAWRIPSSRRRARFALADRAEAARPTGSLAA